jgi:FMN phosphatase YigB (HAD superfamily)
MQLTVRAHELATLLDRASAGITTLSLDCFDTLMWRNVAAPRDVFAEIPLPGGGIEPRVWAEGVSQRMAHSRTGSREVGLDTIYRRMLTSADDARIAEGVAHELACEARHLFPFAPVVELMRDAKRRGLSIIVVSDMYLSEAQLRALLIETAGEEIVGMIDRIFMSSEYGMPKSQGLFIPVLQELGVRPGQVLHVGDNRHADYEGAARCGIHAVHFQQFTDETKQRLRLEAAAGIMLDPATRVTVPAYQPHRAQVSLRRDDEIATVVGHDVMGPVMHAFATYLKGEVDALSAKLGKPVRPLFLMRDGYLPYRAFDTLYPEAGARRIEISRLSAARASLHDEAALDEFVTEYIDVLPADALAKQLLLFGPEVATIVKKRPGHDPQKALKKAMRGSEVRRKVLTRSKKFAERLMAHLRLNDVAEGDAVMLVDVGYKGTVQNIITPVLERMMGLQVSGRYLFLREECMSGLDKAGLLGTDLFECRALHALGTCVAVVEQMCNIAAGSTVDYQPNGEPIREESGLKSQQNAARDAVQAACLDYVRADTSAMHRRPASDTVEARRRMAGAILTRLLFMPIESEIRLFERFDHDVNLGTKAMMKLLDHEGAAEGLRRRGIAYVNETRRMYVPGEILKHGLPLNLSLLTTSRFGLDLRDADFQVGGIDVPVIVINAAEQDVLTIQAHPTHDGYYRIAVPVGASRPTVAVQLGKLAELVQVDAVTWTPLSQYNATWTAKTTDALFMTDGLTTVDDDLYRAAAEGVLIVPPQAEKEAQVLTVVFRPVRWRGEAVARKVAA